MQGNVILKNVLIGVCLSSILVLSGCATSDLKEMVSSGNATTIAAHKLKPINPSLVKIYEKTPMRYKVIGSLSADNYSLIGMEHSQKTLMTKLKKEAASIGANGVIHIHQGLTQTTAEAVLMK